MPPRGKRKAGPAPPPAPPSPPKRQRTGKAPGAPVAKPDPAGTADSLSPVSPLSEKDPTPPVEPAAGPPDPDAPLTDQERRIEDAGHPTTAGKGQGARVPIKHTADVGADVLQDGGRTVLNGSTNDLDDVIEETAQQSTDPGAFNVKAEDQEADVAHLVAGVPVDADDLGVQGPPTIKPAVLEERANVIRFMVVTNDGTPDSMIVLTGLKSIFQRQLPKMPREYIARLVFSRDHWSMAIVKRGLQVVGGITYRPFETRGFAEIVFCAITGTEQVKGYGSHLMNHLKDHVKDSTSCMHFLTYADNYAIGYFKKQGFTKEISLDRAVWAGYIKDYEGGTIMHCAMLPRIKYLEASAMLARQKEVILSKIRLVSRSHVVHKGLEAFRKGASSVDPADVPGLKESGWTPEMDELTRRPQRAPQHNIMQRLLTDLQNHPSAWPFARPINKEEVADYYDVIKSPMDLETMEVKLDANAYANLDEFVVDARQIFQNCRLYNSESSNYVKNANKLEKHMNEKFAQYTVD